MADCTCPFNRTLNQKTYSLYCEDEQHRKFASLEKKVDAFSAQRRSKDDEGD